MPRSVHRLVVGDMPRPYRLQRCAQDGTLKEERRFGTLEALASAAFSEIAGRLPLEAPCLAADDLSAWQAFSPAGRWMALEPLVAYGKRLWLAFWHERRFGPGFMRDYTYRAGPVPRVRRLRGGPTLRHARTQQARREGAFWLAQECEVPVRPKRSANALPDSWDDYAQRQRDRSWKAQRKGRKSWDR